MDSHRMLLCFDEFGGRRRIASVVYQSKLKECNSCAEDENPEKTSGDQCCIGFDGHFWASAFEVCFRKPKQAFFLNKRFGSSLLSSQYVLSLGEMETVILKKQNHFLKNFFPNNKFYCKKFFEL